MITKFKIYENHKDGIPLLRVIAWEIHLREYNKYTNNVAIEIDIKNRFHLYMSIILNKILKELNNYLSNNSIKGQSLFYKRFIEYHINNIGYNWYNCEDYTNRSVLLLETSFERLKKVLDLLPKKLTQEIIDDFCLLYIQNSNDINLSIENLYFNDDYIFSNKIKNDDRYSHYFNAKNFDLI